ncbi:MAG: hypothetical protein ACI9W4_000457 [Rhodothermales bacterium]|jgi:hypothetical protein
MDQKTVVRSAPKKRIPYNPPVPVPKDMEYLSGGECGCMVAMLVVVLAFGLLIAFLGNGV